MVDAADPDGFSFDTTLMALRHAAVQIAEGGFNGWDVDPAQPVTEQDDSYRSLIWRSVGLQEGSSLNGIGVTKDARLGPPGNMAMLWVLEFDPDCDPELELDRLRACAPGVVATLLGSHSDGERFGVLVLQSTPAMDAEWLHEEDEPIGLSGAPDSCLGQWWADVVDGDPLSDEIEHVRDFYEFAFQEALRQAEADAPFAWHVASCWLPYTVIAHHLWEQYGGSDVAAGLGHNDPPLPLREMLRRLLGEAVGIGLDWMVEAETCALPGRAHTCSFEPVSDALTAWLDQVVAPEQFLDHLVEEHAAGAQPSESGGQGMRIVNKPMRATPRGDGDASGPGTFEDRFASFLGPRSQAPALIEALFAAAHEADAAVDDETELTALRRAWTEAERLLDAGVPPGYQAGVADLAEQLGMIFAPFDVEEILGDEGE